MTLSHEGSPWPVTKDHCLVVPKTVEAGTRVFKSTLNASAAPMTGRAVPVKAIAVGGWKPEGVPGPVVPAASETPMKVLSAGLLKVNCDAESTVATVLPACNPGPDTVAPAKRPAVLDTFTVFDPRSSVAPLNRVELPPLTTTLTLPTTGPPLLVCPPETNRCT